MLWTIDVDSSIDGATFHWLICVVFTHAHQCKCLEIKFTFSLRHF